MNNNFNINPGRYRHKITIQKEDIANRIPDGQGGFKENWVTFAETRAEIETIRGQEIYKAMEFDTVLTHRIKTRFIKDVDSKMRIVFGINSDGTPKRIFRIISPVDINEMHRELEILCVELVD